MPNQIPHGADRQLGLHAIQEVSHYQAHADARGPEYLAAHPEAAEAAAARKALLAQIALGHAVLTTEAALPIWEDTANRA